MTPFHNANPLVHSINYTLATIHINKLQFRGRLKIIFASNIFFSAQHERKQRRRSGSHSISRFAQHELPCICENKDADQLRAYFASNIFFKSFWKTQKKSVTNTNISVLLFISQHNHRIISINHRCISVFSKNLRVVLS